MLRQIWLPSSTPVVLAGALFLAACSSGSSDGPIGSSDASSDTTADDASSDAPSDAPPTSDATDATEDAPVQCLPSLTPCEPNNPAAPCCTSCMCFGTGTNDSGTTLTCRCE